MYLHKRDIEQIADILKEFPDVETFELDADTSSGIGSKVTMKFHHKVNSIDGEFSVEIGNVENW